MNPAILACAYVLDLVMGDPEWLPHPVRIIGKMVERGEWMIRKLVRSSWSEFAGGALLSVSIVAVAWFATSYLLDGIERSNNAVAFSVSIYLGSTTLATRCLLTEAGRVFHLLQSGNLEQARLQVSRIVGRDTEGLESPEIVRAAIETLAESSCDGIVAPLFYLALGGVPAAVSYKAINTLDSMIGHRDSRYEYFGKFAARLDDIANFLPARITAFLITLSAFLCKLDWHCAWKIWQRDGRKHSSPNAGHPEAAIAGALGVRLGGLNFYSGELYQGAYLGEPRSPLDCKALNDSLTVVRLVSFLCFTILFAFLCYIYGGLL
ncbi:adenosylcobinamide-phosphate synthase CbiB [bacterium]|nr:adenosylcobinamide-phosphate synthase CbiB [bacterium]